MARIEKLTQEQEARFGEFVERWTKIGLSTEPADRPRAEQGIREMYRAAGLEPPEKIVWCGSPLSQGLTRAIILDKKFLNEIGKNVRASVGDSVRASVRASVGASVWDSVRASVGDSVWDSVRASVGASVGASVWASVWDSVGDSVRDSVRASVWASVWDSVRASVWDSVRDSVRASVWASVRDSVGASVWASVYGQHDAGWLAFYRYFREVCGLETQTQKLSGLLELCQSAGWAIPHEKICWVSERHHILARDERGRLHSVTGPACTYPDGWAIYAVHGVRVPEYIIERPHEITVPKIDSERNAEVRRVMIERYGQARYVVDSGAILVHQLPENYFLKGLQGARLYRKELAGDEPIILIDVANSTLEPDGSTKHYQLRVDPNAYNGRASRECHAAIASTWRNEDGSLYFNKPEDYRPQVET